MAKTAMIRARIEPDLKSEAEEILGQLGLTVTQAIGLFYRQLVLQQRVPFDLALPNKTTLRTFQLTDEGQELVYCADAEDMFQKLGI